MKIQLSAATRYAEHDTWIRNKSPRRNRLPETLCLGVREPFPQRERKCRAPSRRAAIFAGRRRASNRRTGRGGDASRVSQAENLIGLAYSLVNSAPIPSDRSRARHPLPLRSRARGKSRKTSVSYNQSRSTCLFFPWEKRVFFFLKKRPLLRLAISFSSSNSCSPIISIRRFLQDRR